MQNIFFHLCIKNDSTNTHILKHKISFKLELFTKQLLPQNFEKKKTTGNYMKRMVRTSEKICYQTNLQLSCQDGMHAFI